MTWTRTNETRSWHPQWGADDFPGHPLFDTGPLLDQQMRRPNFYPTLQQYFHHCPPGARDDWLETARFLACYVDHPNTYLQFRGELQRFLNYLWSEAGKTLKSTTFKEIEGYLEFCARPPSVWQSGTRAAGFIGHEQDRGGNPLWRPFMASDRPRKPATYAAANRALSLFFSGLAQSGYLVKSPLHTRRGRNANDPRDSTSITRWQAPETLPALTAAEWQFTVEHLIHRADVDPRRERDLFLLMIMKSLFLRVSELGYTSQDSHGGSRFSKMGDFVQGTGPGEKSWLLRVVGARGRERWVPVDPTVWPFVERFRRSLGLPEQPRRGEATALLPGHHLTKAVCKRQVERLITEALRATADALDREGSPESASHLRAISGRTDCLRHTGALLALENGCPVHQLSSWLGHTNIDQTAQLYRPTGFKDQFPRRPGELGCA